MSEVPAAAPYTPAEPVRVARGITIAGVIFAFLIPLVGLILSIVGLVQARSAGQKNGLAIAGIIISVVWPIILGIGITAIIGGACAANPTACTSSVSTY